VKEKILLLPLQENVEEMFLGMSLQENVDSIFPQQIKK
jgi:hypothetical protein